MISLSKKEINYKPSGLGTGPIGPTHSDLTRIWDYIDQLESRIKDLEKEMYG